MAETKVFGRIRKILEALDAEAPGATDAQLTLNRALALLVAIDSTPWDEIVRLGRAYEVHTMAAVAAVVAVPTTGVMLQFFNTDSDAGRSIIIDRVWALMAAGTAAAGQAALIAALGQTRVAAPASAGLAINPLNGNGSKDNHVLAATAALDAVTGVAANWRVLPGQSGGQKVGAAATPGVYINAEVNGRIIVPPGRAFGVHVLADVVGSTFTVGIEAHEKQIDLG